MGGKIFKVLMPRLKGADVVVVMPFRVVWVTMTVGDWEEKDTGVVVDAVRGVTTFEIESFISALCCCCCFCCCCGCWLLWCRGMTLLGLTMTEVAPVMSSR